MRVQDPSKFPHSLFSIRRKKPPPIRIVFGPWCNISQHFCRNFGWHKRNQAPKVCWRYGVADLLDGEIIFEWYMARLLYLRSYTSRTHTQQKHAGDAAHTVEILNDVHASSLHCTRL